MTHRLFSLLLITLIQCVPSTAYADSVGEFMGRSARQINDGATSIYQSTETVVLNSVDTIGDHATEISRSAHDFGNEFSQSFRDFLYDIKKGYGHPRSNRQ